MEGKKPANDVNPHREHQLYEYYMNDLLAHAEASKTQKDHPLQEKADHKRDEPKQD